MRATILVRYSPTEPNPHSYQVSSTAFKRYWSAQYFYYSMLLGEITNKLDK